MTWFGWVLRTLAEAVEGYTDTADERAEAARLVALAQAHATLAVADYLACIVGLVRGKWGAAELDPDGAS